MLILTIRTDKPESEIGLYDNETQLQYIKWQAHRQLAETIHYQIAKLLQSQGKNWNDLQGLVVFKGPGSFTGLRIGLSVANALSYSLKIPIVADNEKDWIQKGIENLSKGKSEKIATPEYGAPAFTTPPKMPFT